MLRPGKFRFKLCALPLDLRFYSAKWLALLHGGSSQSIPIVTAYHSLGAAGLQHALLSTEAVAIFVDNDSILRLETALESVPSIRVVIYDASQEVAGESIRSLSARFSNVVFMSSEDLRRLGQAKPVSLHPPSADDLCAIFYTSGSTGTPKGVPMKHKAVVAAGERNIHSLPYLCAEFLC
jgi:long-chain acyl-CoA synthetase